jgi:hypothetical protein
LESARHHLAHLGPVAGSILFKRDQNIRLGGAALMALSLIFVASLRSRSPEGIIPRDAENRLPSE